ncbi:hypothetical protein EHM69_11535 [candidate division KSB1 bacterium]|nr:MAG: hypothetical protein EHM69_11535 [candidate division KSB1 bacterium]
MLFIFLFLPAVVLAKKPKLILVGHAMAWGASCENGYLTIPAGSRYFLRAVNTVDTVAHPLISDWPEGYVLEAALGLPTGQPFVATPGLIDRMEPKRILSQLNRSSAEGLRQNPAAFWDYEDLNAKDFMLTIPADLGGHEVKFRAIYREGGSDLFAKPTEPISIVTPCDRWDTARVVATRIYEAWETGDYPRIIELADSMLACSLSDVVGWSFAINIARAREQYDKALSYWERSFRDFGDVKAEFGMTISPRPDPATMRDSSTYLRVRDNFLRSKIEHEQQQQQK